MKMRLTFGIVWAALAGTLTFVAASSIQRNVAPQGIQAAQASEAMQARAQAQDEAEDVVPATVTHYAP
ncbi:MAG: hypothetical protein ABI830_12385 [Pseudolabrys sp.]